MVAKKLSAAAGVIKKIKHYIPHAMLKSIYTIAKIQVQQNRIIKVLNKALTFRVKLAPIYN